MKIKQLTSLVLVLFVLLFAACNNETGGFDMNSSDNCDAIIRTDTKPMLDRFPQLPISDNIQWCTTSEVGRIGLDKYDLYLFAFYKPNELQAVLNDISVEFIGQLPDYEEPYFLPEELEEIGEEWSRFNRSGQLFQGGIAVEKQLPAEYYFDLKQGVIYIHASWD